MELKLLGTAPGMPIIDRSHASLLFKFETESILIDAGAGCANQILKEDLTGKNISKIIITHFHPDHSAGILMLLQMWLIVKREEDLTIYIPEGDEKKFWEVMNYFYIFEEVLSCSVKVKKIKDIQMHSCSFHFFGNTHLEPYKKLFQRRKYTNQAISYSVFIKANKTNILYTSDIGSLSDVEDKIIKSNIIIIDGMHIDIEKLFERIKKIDHNKKIVLNHLPANLIKNQNELRKRISKNNLNNVIIAYDGWSLDIEN